MVLPLPAVCLASFGLGVFVEMMMVQWTVTMARNIPPDKLARVSSYDVLGSVMAMPAGALIAGPLGTAIGAARAQYAAAAVIVIASALALIPRDVPHLPQWRRSSGAGARGNDRGAGSRIGNTGTAGAPVAPAVPAWDGQTFFRYERNVATEMATHATAKDQQPGAAHPIAAQSGWAETALRPICTTQLSGLRDAIDCIQPA